MPRTRSLANLRAEVRDRADIENSDHITDAQVDRYINQSGAALHAMLVEHCEDEFVELFSGTTDAASGGITSISLNTEAEVTAGAYKILGVEVTTNGVRSELSRWNWKSRPALLADGVSGPPHFYRWVSYTVQIIPSVPTATPYVIAAIPPYVDLAEDDDTLDGRDGWEEWIVWDAAIKAMVKEETDTREAVAERDRVLLRIKSQMKKRDFAHPHRVVDRDPIDWPYPWGRP